MGISSKNKAINTAMKLKLQQNGYLEPKQASNPAPTSYIDPNLGQTPQVPQFQAPAFVPRPANAQLWVTPLREQGSGTGAQPAFASQQPPGYDPVANFLASLPPLGAQTQPAVQQNQALAPVPLPQQIPGMQTLTPGGNLLFNTIFPNT
jgi:hypothetical protein